MNELKVLDGDQKGEHLKFADDYPIESFLVPATQEIQNVLDKIFKSPYDGPWPFHFPRPNAPVPLSKVIMINSICVYRLYKIKYNHYELKKLKSSMVLFLKPETIKIFLNYFFSIYCLLNEKKRYLVLGPPGVRKNLSVIESYTRIQFKVMSRTIVLYFFMDKTKFLRIIKLLLFSRS